MKKKIKFADWKAASENAEFDAAAALEVSKTKYDFEAYKLQVNEIIWGAAAKGEIHVNCAVPFAIAADIIKWLRASKYSVTKNAVNGNNLYLLISWSNV